MYVMAAGLAFKVVWLTAPDLWQVQSRSGAVAIAQGNDRESMMAFAAVLNCGCGTDVALDLASGPVPVERGEA